ncbi:MAG TPA: DUF2007 domain-containing protein [Candidatus Eisenbacteria bacterium]|nr:DUF2007 domain-containing protein [Candidatus Eisenbacteria bacterium]
MSKLDPDQERTRLAARYAEMSDLELIKVGRDPSALTEWARSALREEMSTRGLEWKPEVTAARPVSELEILLRLGSYSDRDTAGLVRDFLAAKGIQAYFLEEEPRGSEEFAETKSPRGTELLVHAKDLATARSFIAERQDAELQMRQAAPGSSTDGRPVILRRYRDMPAAFVEKSVLENAGIPCFLQDDNVIRMDWLWSNAMGGIKLLVRQRDWEEAERLLAELQSAPRVDEDTPTS